MPQQLAPVNIEPAVVGFTPPLLAFQEFFPLLRAVPRSFSCCLRPFLNSGAVTTVVQRFCALKRLNTPVAQPFIYTPLPQVGLSPTSVTYHFDPASAELLSTDLRDNPGVWLIRESDSSLTSAVRTSVKTLCSPGNAPNPIRVTTFFGVPGCGKTYAASNYVAGRVGAHWAYPSSIVAGQTIATGGKPLGPAVDSSHYLEGYEIFRKSVGTVLVLDDCTKFPPGTLDVLMAINPALEEIVLTGDPAQCNASFPDPLAKSRMNEPLTTSFLLSHPSCSYATVTRRLSVGVAATLGIHTLSLVDGDFIFTSKPPPGQPLFVTSPRFAETKTLGGSPALVVSASQGVEFPGDTCLDLGGMSNSMTDGPVLVGLTRGKRNCFLSFDQSSLAPVSGVWGCSTIVSALIGVSAVTGQALVNVQTDTNRYVASAFAEHVRRSVPSLRTTGPVLPLVGASIACPPLVGAMQDTIPSLKGCPTLTSVTAKDFLNFHTPVATRLPRPESSPPNLDHSPPEPTVPADTELFFDQGEFADAEHRELKRLDQLSSQLPEHKHPYALHHKRGDNVTTFHSEKKRLFYASPAANRSNVKSHQTRFTQLQRGFLRVFPKFKSVRQFDALVEQCAEEVLDSWATKKTLADIRKSLGKADVDHDFCQTKLFLKSQVVRKIEKRGKPASAGQIVTEFALGKTFRDNTFALAIEKIILNECPSHVYLHLRRSTSDLQDWVQTNMSSTSSFTETDYTAWDSSIDGPFIKFDGWLMGQLGFPSEYISTYMTEACTTTARGRNLRLMQHSGNRYTFLFNTVRNLALTQASYAQLEDVPQAYGGDDSLIGSQPPVRVGFKASSWLMMPKVQHTEVGHLFGHRIQFGRLSYDYAYIKHRLEVAIVERPLDTDFFYSLVNQMVALPLPDDEYYSACYTMLHSHVVTHELVVPGLTAPLVPLNYSDQSIQMHLLRPSRRITTWSGH
jgi:hypothetical protein